MATISNTIYTEWATRGDINAGTIFDTWATRGLLWKNIFVETEKLQVINVITDSSDARSLNELNKFKLPDLKRLKI